MDNVKYKYQHTTKERFEFVPKSVSNMILRKLMRTRICLYSEPLFFIS